MIKINIGDKFNKWTILEKIGRNTNIKSKGIYYKALCECGYVGIVYGSRIARKLNKGCRQCGWNSIKTHGLYKTPEYRIWNGMRDRCTNPKTTGYENYGGRGIKVCERWNSFTNFLQDMGKRTPGMTLDRIDNNGNYEPSNCAWVTPKQNSNNRRNSKKNRGKWLYVLKDSLCDGCKQKCII